MLFESSLEQNLLFFFVKSNTGRPGLTCRLWRKSSKNRAIANLTVHTVYCKISMDFPHNTILIEFFPKIALMVHIPCFCKDHTNRDPR